MLFNRALKLFQIWSSSILGPNWAVWVSQIGVVGTEISVYAWIKIRRTQNSAHDSTKPCFWVLRFFLLTVKQLVQSASVPRAPEGLGERRSRTRQSTIPFPPEASWSWKTRQPSCEAAGFASAALDSTHRVVILWRCRRGVGESTEGGCPRGFRN